MTFTGGFFSYLLTYAGLSSRQGHLALVSWQKRGPLVEIFFSSFLTFIHLYRAKYQKFRDFSLGMYSYAG